MRAGQGAGVTPQRALAPVVAAPNALSMPTAGLVAAQAAVATPVSIALGPLFLIFLKIGSVLFGSGYVLLAFLRADLVRALHWLTERQLLDAVAIGQVTPGPVFTTATFIGYILARYERRRSGDARHLPSRVRIRRAERSIGSATAPVSDRRSRARRSQRGLARTDGRRGVAAGPVGARRRDDSHRAVHRERAAPRPMARELGVARPRRRDRRAGCELSSLAAALVKPISGTCLGTFRTKSGRFADRGRALESPHCKRIRAPLARGCRNGDPGDDNVHQTARTTRQLPAR